MGVEPQTFANGLKPYGSHYRTLSAQNAPVPWLTNPISGQQPQHLPITRKANTVFCKPAKFAPLAGNNTPKGFPEQAGSAWLFFFALAIFAHICQNLLNRSKQSFSPVLLASYFLPDYKKHLNRPRMKFLNIAPSSKRFYAYLQAFMCSRKLHYAFLALALLGTQFAFAQTNISIEEVSVNDNTPNELQNITFTVKIKNNGPLATSALQIKDLLPATLTFVSATAPAGTTYTSGTGIWNIGALSSGQNLTLTIIAFPNAGTSGVNITNTASYFSSTPADNNATDN
ncbi:hypothetical protein C7N43_37190, partial [Sphingobacteriales bacterium UPWRP_1]